MIVRARPTFSEEEQLRLRESLLRIIPVSDQIADAFFAALPATEDERVLPSESDRDALMLTLASVVDLVESFDKLIRARDGFLRLHRLFGDDPVRRAAAETAFAEAMVQAGWPVLEPGDLELWQKLFHALVGSDTSSAK